MSESQSDSLSEAQADTILRKSRFLFGGRLAIYWSRRPSICQETLFFSLCSDKQRCYTRGGSTSRWSGITSWESGHRVWAPNTGILGFSWNHNNQRPTTRDLSNNDSPDGDVNVVCNSRLFSPSPRRMVVRPFINSVVIIKAIVFSFLLF